MSPEQLTIAGLLLAAIAAGARGMWVFGWIYRAAIVDRDFWRDRALLGTGLAEIATEQDERRR